VKFLQERGKGEHKNLGTQIFAFLELELGLRLAQELKLEQELVLGWS